MGEADKKDSVESAKYDINICSSSRTYSYWAFFHGFGFSGSDPDFWPIRIRTQGKQSDPDPGRIRTKGPGSETLPTNLEKSFVQNLIYFFLFLSKIDIIMLCKKTKVGHNGS